MIIASELGGKRPGNGEVGGFEFSKQESLRTSSCVHRFNNMFHQSFHHSVGNARGKGRASFPSLASLSPQR